MRPGRNTVIWAGVFLLSLLLLGVWAALCSGREEAPRVTMASVEPETPQGETTTVDGNKTDGYMKDDSRRRNSVEDLWDGIDAAMAVTDDAEPPVPGEDVRAEPRSVAQLKKDLLTSDEPEEPKAPAARKSSGGGGGAARTSSRPMTQKERDDKVRHDYELASEIAMKMYGLDGEQAASADESDPVAERITVPRSGGGRTSSGTVSSLDGGWDSGGLSSLDGEVSAVGDDEDRPFRCMFTRDEKIRSGQRVTLRLLEDMVIDGVAVPANSHITAVCSVKDRLMVSVQSFELGGRIYSLELEGYDTDGTLGIYCPGVSGEAARTARNDALSLGQTVARGSLGTIASGIVRTGVSIAKSAGSGEVSVTVPAGYTFYVMKRKKR